MSVRLVEGDLLKATEQIIGHQVNCQAVMGSGVAKQIKRKYPHVFKEYVQFCHMYREGLLGKCQFVEVGQTGDRYVANLFGQERYGTDGRKYTNDEALRSALQQVYAVAKAKQFSVALPYKIGCDRGGGDWEAVSAMIRDVFKDVQVTLYRWAPESKDT